MKHFLVLSLTTKVEMPDTLHDKPSVILYEGKAYSWKISHTYPSIGVVDHMYRNEGEPLTLSPKEVIWDV